MKKTYTKLLLQMLAAVLAAALIMSACLVLLSVSAKAKAESAKKTAAAKEEALDPEKFAEENELVDIDKETGDLYVNRDLVVFASYGVTRDRMKSVADGCGAKLEDSMADVGVYKFTFTSSKSHTDLMNLTRQLKGNPAVAEVSLNYAAISEEESAPEGEGEAETPPYYPADNWGGDRWNISVPRGNNWAMEAINAPGAWGYLGSMQRVRIGWIDSYPSFSHPDMPPIRDSSVYIDGNTGAVINTSTTPSASDHGTMVGSLMGALFDNAEDGMGGTTGGKAELYFSRTYCVVNNSIESRFDTSYTYMLAIKKLLDQDVRVINISQNTSRLIGFAASRGNQNAINYLTSQANLAGRTLRQIIETRKASGRPDFVICIAAGNNNTLTYEPDANAAYGYVASSNPGSQSGNALAVYNNFLSLISDEEVSSRIIVVGAMEIDYGRSSSSYTAYSYCDFSNVGERVDIVAPGVGVYGAKADGGYYLNDGTSFSTPIVASVAGMVTAANSELTGPEVKQIVLASAKGEYKFYQGSAGLVDAKTAVELAIKAKTSSVGKVVNPKSGSLDLCLIVDTTGSMNDDIDNAKQNMRDILSSLAETTEDYRVALVDYRDFSSRSGSSADYPAKIQLDFSTDNDEIVEAINGLSLGDGGDWKETVYSGIMEALNLDWRENATKVIIVIGDAAPLDPEPNTGYTYEQIVAALAMADTHVDIDASHDIVMGLAGDGSDCAVNVFSINTSDGIDIDFFSDVAEVTGGGCSAVDNPDEVSDAIIGSIEQIDVVSTVNATAKFGEGYRGMSIDIYDGKEYVCTVETEKDGTAELLNIVPKDYTWRCEDQMTEGTLRFNEDGEKVRVKEKSGYWFTSLMQLWAEKKALVIAAAAGAFVVVMLIPLLLGLVKNGFGKMKKKREAKKAERAQKRAKYAPAPAYAGTSASAGSPVPPVQTVLQAQPAAAPAAVFCPNCGARANADDVFCESCGFKLK